MPKLFDKEIVYGRRVSEDKWFKDHQILLRWMANTVEGKKLLCLDQTDIGEVHEIAKNYVRNYRFVKEGEGFRRIAKTDYRIGAKWGNIIRYKWNEFNELASRFFMEREQEQIKLPERHPLKQLEFAHSLSKMKFTTSTFYPDPSPETTSVDGYCNQVQNSQDWTTLRNAAGTSANDSVTYVEYNFAADAVTDKWDRMTRNFYLFDTSSLGTDTIDSAVMTVFQAFGGGPDDPSSNDPNLGIYSSNPASNTALVAGDYDTVGDTLLSSEVAFSAISGSAVFTFNGTGEASIAKTGISKYSMRIDYDVSDTAMTWGASQQTRWNTRFADQTGTSVDPKLVVEHTAAVTGSNSGLSRRHFPFQ